MREAMVTAVTHEKPTMRGAGPADAARTLRALLPEQTALSSAEQHLLGEWLNRLASDGQTSRPGPAPSDTRASV